MANVFLFAGGEVFVAALRGEERARQYAVVKAAPPDGEEEVAGFGVLTIIAVIKKISDAAFRQRWRE
jgi:hypothetical protein